jgi:hypothetical protein
MKMNVHYKFTARPQALGGKSREAFVIDSEEIQKSDLDSEWFESYASDLKALAAKSHERQSFDFQAFEDLILGFADGCWQAARFLLPETGHGAFTELAADAKILSFFDALEPVLPNVSATFQAAVFSLIEGLSAFSDRWAAFFSHSCLVSSFIAHARSSDDVDLCLAALQAMGQLWVYQLEHTSESIPAMFETVRNLPLGEESLAAQAIKMLGILLSRLDLDQATLSDIAELLLHALDCLSPRIMKRISRAALQILKRDSEHADFIANHGFFPRLLGQVNELVSLGRQIFPADIFILMFQLIRALNRPPDKLVPILEMIEADSYHIILTASPLPAAAACLEAVILFVLWNAEAALFFSDRFMTLTWDFDDPDVRRSMGAVWLRFCHALMLTNSRTVAGELFFNGIIEKTSEFIDPDNETCGYFLHLVVLMIEESVTRETECDVVEAILHVEGLAEEIEVLQQWERTFVTPRPGLTLPIAEMATFIIEFLARSGADANEVFSRE